MKKNEWIQKLTSRKFIISALSALTGILSIILGENEAVNTIMGTLMVIIPSVIYCIMEGKIDVASAKAIGTAVADAAAQLGANRSTLENLEKIN